MTRDDIYRMAQEAGFMTLCINEDTWIPYLSRFAKLVAAAEREACASIEVHLTTPDRDYTNMSPLDAYEAALMDAAMAFRKAIRERGAT
jgi:hypothetical protein